MHLQAMESFFGFISVLPGAFSAYRWAAIRGSPLKSYFMAEERSLRDLGPYLANLLLAEDRILCLEVVTRPTRAWTLRWVPGAVASTDVPDTLRELTQQRRRWLNGSFFNILYVLQHWRKILRSRHPWWRKTMLVMQYCFVLTTTIISWFAVASLYLSFQVIFEAVLAVTEFGSNEFGFGFSTIYALLVLSLVIVGLAGDIRHTETFYRFVATVFGFITLMGFAAGVFLFTTFASDAFIVISVFATFFMYFLAALIHGQAVHVVGSMLQYLAMMPTYITVFTVYSFCHLNDISWGTKEGNSQSESRLKHLEFARKNADEAAELDSILENFLMARTKGTKPAEPSIDHHIAQESKDAAPETSATTAPLTSVVVNGMQPNSPPPEKTPRLEEIPEEDSELGYAIVGRPPVGMGASVISAGTRQPHLAEDVKNSTDADFDDKISEAGILVKMARRVLPGDQGDMIKEARKVLRAHRVAEKRALLQAKKLEVDKKEAIIEFNQFRMTMLGVWIGSNLLFLGIISNYNLLSSFALAASVLILYMGGVKLLASCLLVISMRSKSCFQCCCRNRCYRSDELTGKLICCCYSDDYYYIDELWEIEQDELHGTRLFQRQGMTAADLIDEENGSYVSSHGTEVDSDAASATDEYSIAASTSSSPSTRKTTVSDHQLEDVSASRSGRSSVVSFVSAETRSALTPAAARPSHFEQAPLEAGLANGQNRTEPTPAPRINEVVSDADIELERADIAQLNTNGRRPSLTQPMPCHEDDDFSDSEVGTDLVDVLDGIDLQI